MKKISLALIMLIIVGICIPAVSAEEVLNEHINAYVDTSASVTYAYGSHEGSGEINLVRFNKIEDHRQVNYVIFNGKEKPYKNAPDEGRYEITYTLGGVTKPAVMHISASRNLLGSITSYRYIVFFEDWDIGDLTGVQDVTLSKSLGFYRIRGGTPSGWGGFIMKYAPGAPGVYYYAPPNIEHDVIISSQNAFENQIVVDLENGLYNVQILRYLGGNYYKSTMNVRNNDTIVYTNSENIDKSVFFDEGEINKIDINAPDGTIYAYLLTSAGHGDTPQDPDNTIVTVYVKNSQTYALIADSHIVISASVDNEFHEVINQTLPSGTYTGNLQPTGGGLPNPDFYRLITTAEGYNSIMPHMDFEFDEAVTIYDYLDPIGGAPEDENNTFIDFFVRDMSANPISGATVNFGGYTLITNSAGYTIFEVDKSKTYSWTVSKSGYGSLTGNVVIGDDPRHTINTVLAPAVTPTKPTVIPTSTPISPTPTMTSPTGEPVSNWLEWFASHFGMILGGGAEIGKIFMWLCFSVPVGVYVGKEAKAGAAGFLAGAGIVTLFFVLIGWVPIWLLVLIALIVGLLYAKVFNNSDNGGGR